ncbi:MAG: MBL fold metallo-hydrolase [Flavobacteriales bacterium]|nr:MBL fold metallo-hydrolase [Flavobacteriales bacterium]
MWRFVFYLSTFLALTGCVATDPDNPECKTEAPDVYEPVNVEDDWYNVTYVEPRTYIIEEPSSSQGNVSYLILGTERAVMFDTGAGENNPVTDTKMKYLIDQITDLPVTLLLSHFHFDHNQNIQEFDHVAFIELEYLVNGTSPEGIYTFTEEQLVEGNFPESVEVDEWWTPQTSIDLGDRTIEIWSIPGHADESAMIVDYENKLLFMGDFIYNGPMFVFGEQNVPVYIASTDVITSSFDSSYTLYGAHGLPEVDFDDLFGLRDVLVCIDENTCTASMFNLFGYVVYAYSLNGMEVWVLT